jgi:hypothetical protein
MFLLDPDLKFSLADLDPDPALVIDCYLVLAGIYIRFENHILPPPQDDISKMQTCLSDRMLPKEVKLNKLFKFYKSHFLSFIDFNSLWERHF